MYLACEMLSVLDCDIAVSCDVLAIEFSSESARIEAAKNFPKPSLSRVPQMSRSAVAQPSRVGGQAIREVVHSGIVSAYPFLANFTWDQVAAMTRAANNEVLGKGGFGPVYMGILPNNKLVAVKILDTDSRQGSSEFLNEVN